MVNLQQHKSVVESIGLWRSLNDKENELNSIADVLRYHDEKEVLEQQIKDLEESMIPAMRAYRKRKSLLNCLLSSDEAHSTKNKAAKVKETEIVEEMETNNPCKSNSTDDECVVAEKETVVEKAISSDDKSSASSDDDCD